jgi:hypothetical protein
MNESPAKAGLLLRTREPGGARYVPKRSRSETPWPLNGNASSFLSAPTSARSLHAWLALRMARGTSRGAKNGWSVGHAPDLKDLSRFWPREGGFALAGDAQLVAEVWAAGLGGELLSHSYEDVTVNDEDASDVVAAWDCPCGVGELDFDNIGEARAAARAHWRTALRETLDLKE